MPRWRTTRTRCLHLYRALPSATLPAPPSLPPADRVVGRHPRRHRTLHMTFALALALRHHPRRSRYRGAAVLCSLHICAPSALATVRFVGRHHPRHRVSAVSDPPNLARVHLLDVTSVLRDGLRCRLPLLRLGWANGLRSCVLRPAFLHTAHAVRDILTLVLPR
ncbi:hypothetical protein B0H13DRAFT_2305883 [Mycena leptocephala]|nr:hypothetical protein B0H13DRAFT_2305883 [Mycena leptocephala]